MEFKKGSLLIEGKTKQVWEVEDQPDLVILENKKDITAFDDPEFTQSFDTKDGYATTTTCRVFELLKAANIPIAYVEPFSATEFVAQRCERIFLEVIARRYAVGSYIARNPHLASGEEELPHRFHSLLIEFFLKTSDGKLTNNDGTTILEVSKEDPFIINPDDEEVWNLFHPKKHAWDPEADLGSSIQTDLVLESILSKFGYSQRELMRQMREITKEVFLVLEGAFAGLSHRLIDFKIEFGLDKAGQLCVIDVIDNDSWRVRDSMWEELSKQSFRDGQDLSEVERKYGIVTRLVEQFRVPYQALILWRGSEADKFPEVPDEWLSFGLDVPKVTISGHKSPSRALARLEEILSIYPDGGVIVAKVGRSNGLGPTLAARTTWPVIAIPATIKESPEDVWSSVRMPSNVPLATVWPEQNALLMAANILAAKNPLLYMWRQKQIEELDN